MGHGLQELGHEPASPLIVAKSGAHMEHWQSASDNLKKVKYENIVYITDIIWATINMCHVLTIV